MDGLPHLGEELRGKIVALDIDTGEYEVGDKPSEAADKLHGSLLLVHGSSDDNVHFQNSVQMVDALVKAGKQFRFMIYPNKTHGIGGSSSRVHLFHMIEDQFEHELKLNQP